MSIQKQRILFIGLVWPEPNSSAAGNRIIQLVELFRQQDYEIHFASAAQKSEYSFPLENLAVRCHQIRLNDSSFDHWIKELAPNMVIYDRFVSEEQFGWRINRNCPNMVSILDTEDLHFLRKSRLEAQKTGHLNLYTETTKREIAAILRCDLSLIISKTELNLLTNQFSVAKDKLLYLPFLENKIDTALTVNWQQYEQRAGFVFIGNFIHEPNWQAVLCLKNEILPRLKRILPNVGIHIYGAYPSEKVLQLHQPKANFYIHGRADDAQKAICQHRVMLAPLTAGAGIKGKFIDAMQSGTPSITSSIGAEDMHLDDLWNGFITDNWDDFCEKAVLLYNDKQQWQEAQSNGIRLHNKQYNSQKWRKIFFKKLMQLQENLYFYRQKNYIGEILKHQSLQSTKYLSLWIEEKNKNK